MKTIIHVNSHIIRGNAKNSTNDPPITIRRGRNKIIGRATEVMIDGPSKIVYSPCKPLSCGARMWIETESEVLYE